MVLTAEVVVSVQKAVSASGSDSDSQAESDSDTESARTGAVDSSVGAAARDRLRDRGSVYCTVTV